jgi:hypothetical protein
MTTDHLECFELLGVEPGRMTVRDVQVSAWGSEVLISCAYEGDGPRPFQLLFEECSSIQWDVHGNLDDPDTDAELMGLFLGEEAHREAAIIYAEPFEIAVLYGSFTLIKDW